MSLHPEGEVTMDKCDRLISDALGIEVYSYNQQVSLELWGVLELLANAKEKGESIYNTEIANELRLTPSHVELIQYLLCNNDHAEYGTSPRGCWLTDKGLDLYRRAKELIGKDPNDD